MQKSDKGKSVFKFNWRKTGAILRFGFGATPSLVYSSHFRWHWLNETPILNLNRLLFCSLYPRMLPDNYCSSVLYHCCVIFVVDVNATSLLLLILQPIWLSVSTNTNLTLLSSPDGPVQTRIPTLTMVKAKPALIDQTWCFWKVMNGEGIIRHFWTMLTS